MPKSLNDLSTEELKQITDLSALFFTPRDIAKMLEFNETDFAKECKASDSKIHDAYYSGYLQGQVDLRTGIMKMAKAGSSPAQTMALELLKQTKLKLLE